MKILHIGQLIGGIDVYIRNVIANSHADVQYAIIYGEDDNPQLDFFKNHNVKLYTTALHRNLNVIDDLKAFFDILKVIHREHPDVIHCHSAKSGFIGRIVGAITHIKTFYTPHAFSFLSTPKYFKRLLYRLLEHSAIMSSYLLACSESERKLGVEIVGYPKDRALVWHNSIPKAPAINNFDVVGNYRFNDYICYMARPSYQKNPGFLLNVMSEVHKRLPHLRFCLLGIGYHSPDLLFLKAGIAKLGLTGCVDMFSWLPHEICLEYIKHCKLYLTVSRYEGISLTALEAMSLGKVIVASDVVGNRDCVFNGQNGYLLPFDPSLFATKIAEIIRNDELRKRMEANSLRIFREKFFIDNRINELDKIYASDYSC